jgi:hypothetical protein
MRILSEYPQAGFRLVLFTANDKWIVKAEAGVCEQIFKFPQLEVSREEVEAWLKDDAGQAWRETVRQRFHEMHMSLAMLNSAPSN